MTNFNNIAFLFPGQGAQYVGMGRAFFDSFLQAKETYQLADDLLERGLSKTIFEGPESQLVETRNSQLGIFVTSMALLNVIKHALPSLNANFYAGLSLGEYSALCAANYASFEQVLSLVNYRAKYMNDACEKNQGSMAVVLGLTGDEVESLVKEANLPHDLWAANFNCPGQVVISGTEKGIKLGAQLLLEKGAKRVLPLSVHGAFHSGLMEEAKKRLSSHIENSAFHVSSSSLVMNVTGEVVKDISMIKNLLIEQVTQPVRWEKCIRTMMDSNVDLYVEIGCGKTLAGFNKRIVSDVPTISVEAPEDLEKLYKILS